MLLFQWYSKLMTAFRQGERWRLLVFISLLSSSPGATQLESVYSKELKLHRPFFFCSIAGCIKKCFAFTDR